MFVFGGFGTDHPDDLFRFDYITEEWSIVATKGSKPCGRSRSRMTLHNDKLIVVGGWDRNVHFADFWELNLKTFYWTKLSIEFGETGLSQHSLVIFEESLYILGGFSQSKDAPTNSLYRVFL